jgi:hypothetical protein
VITFTVDRSAPCGIPRRSDSNEEPSIEGVRSGAWATLAPQEPVPVFAVVRFEAGAPGCRAGGRRRRNQPLPSLSGSTRRIRTSLPPRVAKRALRLFTSRQLQLASSGRSRREPSPGRTPDKCSSDQTLSTHRARTTHGEASDHTSRSSATDPSRSSCSRTDRGYSASTPPNSSRRRGIGYRAVPGRRRLKNLVYPARRLPLSCRSPRLK